MQQFNPTVSLVRVLSMLLIIATHFLTWQKINSYQISTIGVSCFLFISGYLYGEKKIENKLIWFQQRIKKILVPFWIIVFFLSVFLIVKGEYLLAGRQIFESLLNIQGIHSIIRIPFELGHGHLSGLGHCWFLTVIMICYLLVLGVKNSRVERFVDNYPYISFFLIVLLHVAFSFINVAIGCFVVFFIGYFYRRKKSLLNVSNGYLVWLLLVTCVAFVARCLLKRIIDGEDFYDFFIASISSNICAFTFFVFVHWLCQHLKLVADIPSKKWWKQLDSLTFPLYLTHYMFLKEPFNLKVLFPDLNNTVLLVLFLLFSLLTAVLLNFICKIIFREV